MDYVSANMANGSHIHRPFVDQRLWILESLVLNKCINVPDMFLSEILLGLAMECTRMIRANLRLHVPSRLPTTLLPRIHKLHDTLKPIMERCFTFGIKSQYLQCL